jgi:hypothetical protein
MFHRDNIFTRKDWLKLKFSESALFRVKKGPPTSVTSGHDLGWTADAQAQIPIPIQAGAAVK